MKRKKIITIIVVALCLTLSAGLAVFLGVRHNKKKANNVDMSHAFKSVALNIWSKIGVDDAVSNTSGISYTSYYDIPKLAESPKTDGDRLQLKMTANSMACFSYFVASLFDNDNFSLINDVAKFSATISSSETGNKNYSFTINPFVAASKNKLSLNLYYEVDSIIYYYVIEADFDFNTNSLNSARIYARENTLFVDIQIPSTGDLLIYSTYNTGDVLSNSIEADMYFFLDKVKYVEKSNFSYSAELERIFTIKNSIIINN